MGYSSTLASFVGSTFGSDLSNAAVTSNATWWSAVSVLRTPAGHNVSNPSSFPNPPAWAKIESNLALSLVPVSGNPNATIATLNALGVSLVAVTQLTCNTFSFSSLDQTTAVYWAERWELYKHQYALSVYFWKRGVPKFELWNEPDASLNYCINATTLVEHITVRSLAVQHAFADLNADAASGALPCGFAACPATPSVLVSAFASAGFYTSAGAFGQAAVQAEHLLFPPFANVTSPAYSNMQAYSWHSYGKTGFNLQGAGSSQNGVGFQAAGIAAYHTPSSTRLPVIVTEHASHTGSDWDGFWSSSDDGFEAARLANQLVWASQNGIETYSFKFSATPYSGGGVTKSGLHWGSNVGAPFGIGDTTSSGEAVALLAPPLLGGKQMLTCVQNYTAANGTRSCTVILDPASPASGQGSRVHILYVNEPIFSSSSLASQSYVVPSQVRCARLRPHTTSFISISHPRVVLLSPSTWPSTCRSWACPPRPSLWCLRCRPAALARCRSSRPPRRPCPTPSRPTG